MSGNTLQVLGNSSRTEFIVKPIVLFGTHARDVSHVVVLREGDDACRPVSDDGPGDPLALPVLFDVIDAPV